MKSSGQQHDPANTLSIVRDFCSFFDLISKTLICTDAFPTTTAFSIIEVRNSRALLLETILTTEMQITNVAVRKVDYHGTQGL